MSLNIFNNLLGTNSLLNNKSDYTLIQELKFLLNLPNDSNLSISTGLIPGVVHINKFGEELVAGAGVANIDIIGNGNGVYVPPKADRIHQVKSDNIADIGVLIGTYTSTTFDQEKFIDANATFIADGVSVGDVLVNDTTQDHSLVISVDSQIQLTVEPWHHTEESNVGGSIRIASPGSTGAVFLHIKGGQLKDGTISTEFVLLNGTTNVPTVSPYYRITRMHIHGSGTNKTNVGKITATADVDLTVTSTITENRGQTLMAYIHVPQGKTAYMTSFYCSMFRSLKVANAMGRLQLMSNLWGGDGEVVEHTVGLGATGGFVQMDYAPYKRFTQGTDVWLRSVETTDTASRISAGFDMIIIDNDLLK